MIVIDPMMVLLIQLFPFTLLLVTSTALHVHNSTNQTWELEAVGSYVIEFKPCDDEIH